MPKGHQVEGELELVFWGAILFSFLQMGKVWDDLKPKLSCLFAGPHNALTPPRSPQDGVCPH